MKNWLTERFNFSHENVITVTSTNFTCKLQNYLLMDSTTFSELLEMVTFPVWENDTVMRKANRKRAWLNCVLFTVHGKLSNIATNFQTYKVIVLMQIISNTFSLLTFHISINIIGLHSQYIFITAFSAQIFYRVWGSSTNKQGGTITVLFNVLNV